MNKADSQVVATIGHLKRQDGRWRVRCAACGSGRELIPRPGNPAPARTAAATSLRDQGWHEGHDGLWRCPEHANNGKVC